MRIRNMKASPDMIDESGVIAPRLESSEEVVYEPTDLTLDEARRAPTDRFGILWIGGDIMTCLLYTSRCV